MVRNSLQIQLFLRGITATAIAKKAQVSISFAARCIRGKARPSKKIIEALRAFGVEMEDDK